MGRLLSEVIDEIGIGTYQWVQLLLVGGVMIADGAEILVASSVLGALSDVWGLTHMVKGLMMSIIFVGVFAGGIVGGNIADAYGRRKGLLVAYIGIVIFGAGTAVCQGPIQMIVTRFFFGASFGCGMGPGVTFQSETSPTQWRAHMINLGGIFFCLGEVYTSILLVIFMPDLTDPTGDTWRWVTLLSMMPGFLLLPFTWFLLQESPQFLLTQSRRTEAIEALTHIAVMNKKGEICDGLDSDDPARRLDTANPAPVAVLAEALETSSAAGLLDNDTSAGRRSSASSSGRPDRGSGSSSEDPEVKPLRPGKRGSVAVVEEGVSVLFSKEYIGIIIGGSYLCIVSNFLFYGLTYALPGMFGDLKAYVSPAVQVLIVSICDLPGVLLSFFLIYAKGISHRTGMTILIGLASIFSLTLMSIEQGPAGLYVGLPSAYLMKYVSSAFFTLCYVYLSEVFPARVRATGLSLCIAAGRLGSMLAPVIVEALERPGFPLGPHAPFLILTSGLCLLAMLTIRVCLHFERKNEALTDRLPAQLSEKKAEKRKSIEVDLTAPAAAG